MSNRHESGNKLANLNIATLDQHMDETKIHDQLGDLMIPIKVGS
jgi:hypothetical protein